MEDISLVGARLISFTNAGVKPPPLLKLFFHYVRLFCLANALQCVIESRIFEDYKCVTTNTEVFVRLFENYFHSNFNIDGSLDLFKKREPEWPDLCATQTYKENKELIDLYFDQKLPVLASKKPLTHDNFENLEKQETL